MISSQVAAKADAPVVVKLTEQARVPRKGPLGGKIGFKTKYRVRVLWREKSEHVREHSKQYKKNKKQNKTITRPVKPLQINFLEPRIFRSVCGFICISLAADGPQGARGHLSHLLLRSLLRRAFSDCPTHGTVLLYLVLCLELNDTLHAMKR